MLHATFFMQLFCCGAPGFWVIFGLPGPFWVHPVVDFDISNHLASDLLQTSPPRVPWDPIYNHKTITTTKNIITTMLHAICFRFFFYVDSLNLTFLGLWDPHRKTGRKKLV